MGLLRRLDYRAALSLLGVPRIPTGLPARVRCPHCQQSNKLTVWYDQLTDGHYLNCSACKLAGDIVDLAAATWKTNLTDAVQRLSASMMPGPGSIPRAVLIYLHQRDLTQNRRGAVDMYSRHQRPLVSNPEAIQLARRLQLNLDPRVSWASGGMPEFLGYAPGLLLDRCLAGHGTSMKRDARRAQRFVPSQWEKCLVAPIEDYPGRVIGYSLLGREASGLSGEKYVPLPIAREAHASGFWVHPGLRDYVDPLIVTASARLAAQLHASGFSRQPNPIPVIAAPREDSHRPVAWSRFYNQRLVCWSPKLDTTAVWHAIASDSQLAIAGPAKEQSVADYLTQTDPRRICERVIATARDWPDAVAILLKNVPEPELAVFVSNLQTNASEAERILEACTPTVRQQVKRAMRGQPAWSGVSTSAGMVERRGDAIYLVTLRGEQQLCNLSFQVTDLIRYAQHNAMYFRVECFFQGRRYIFVFPEAKFRRYPLQLLSEALAKQNVGSVAYLPHWQQKILTAALSLSPPRVRTASCGIGYSASARCFEMGDCTINAGGRAPRRLGQLFGDTAACLSGCQGDPELIKQLPEVARTLLLRLVDQIVRPVGGNEQSMITLSGPGAGPLLDSVKRAVGLVAAPMCRLQAANGYFTTSSYPVIVSELADVGLSRARWTKIASEVHRRSILAVGDGNQGRWTALIGGYWLPVEQVESIWSPEIQQAVGAWLLVTLSDWFTDGCRERFLPRVAQNLGLDAKLVQLNGRDAGAALISLIRRAVRSSVITLQSQSVPVSLKTPILLDGKQLFVPITAVLALLRALGLPTQTIAYAQGRLAISRRLRSHVVLNNITGWLFDSASGVELQPSGQLAIRAAEQA